MSVKTQKILSAIILAIFGFYNLFVGVLFVITIQSPRGVLFIISALAALLGILGIKNKNKSFLWIGVVISAIQLLNGAYSLIGTVIFGTDASFAGSLFTIVVYLLPISLMYKMIKGKQGRLNWPSFKI
ncbi:MAG: hypothetical protein JWP09_133 [Candidatus Taylorbacteria bacterium]|nr:hypothetical protein [Candidatus Taylorbacteria bacterium]